MTLGNFGVCIPGSDGIYLSIFSISGGDWHLGVASIKQMAATFAAFDHPQTMLNVSLNTLMIYCMCMPQHGVTMFQQGAFVASISGRPWHSVGIDESHEMMANRISKMSTIRPSHEGIDRWLHYMPIRSRMIENVSVELFPEQETVHKSESSLTNTK